MVLMMVLAGLSACQQQEKAKPADPGQAMEEAVPAAKESMATNMAEPAKTTNASSAQKSAAEPAAPSKEQAMAPTKETMAEAGKEVAAAMPVAEMAGNPVKGAKLAKGKCGACHYFDQDKKKVGPTLKGIFNRAPAIEGVPYAKWDEAALDAWLVSPKAVKPKTKMAFKGIPEKDKRDDLIAYLKTL